MAKATSIKASAALYPVPLAVSELFGVKIEQGEDFVIVPFETQLEEIA